MAERRRPRQPSPSTPVTVTARGYWRTDPQVPALYADHLFVHLLGNQFTLTFGRVEQPYEPFTDELQERMRTEGLPVLQVAKVAVRAEKIGEMIQALAGLYETWRQAQQPQKPSEAGE